MNELADAVEPTSGTADPAAGAVKKFLLVDAVGRIAEQHHYAPPPGLRFEGSPDVLDPIITGGRALRVLAHQRTLFGIPVWDVYPLKPGAWQVVDGGGRVLASGVADIDGHLTSVSHSHTP